MTWTKKVLTSVICVVLIGLGSGADGDGAWDVPDLSALLQGPPSGGREGNPTTMDSQRSLAAETFNKKYTMTLSNYGDAQYLAHVRVGGQKLKGILDSGSFDLVVFPQSCQTCGIAAKFRPGSSRTFQQGILTSSQAYGSGETSSVQAYDIIRLGSLPEVNQSFWTVEFATMPLLYNAAFHTIIGIGPPETPAADAWKLAKQDVEKVVKRLDQGLLLTKDNTRMIEESLQVAREVSNSQALLHAMGISDFSLCIGAEPGSDGYMTWNDDAKDVHPGLFQSVPVIGAHTWSVPLSHARLEGPGNATAIDMGCEDGCSALLDSGTSLMAVPSEIYGHLEGMIKRLDPDCKNIDDLPDIVFNLHNTRISLPPSSYVAEATGSVPAHLQGLLRMRSRDSTETAPRCQLFIMELKSKSKYGSTWILGMPFFRKYYTQFSVGTSKAERQIAIAPSDGSCQPATANMNLAVSKRSVVRRIEMSRLYVPPRVQDATEDRFVVL